MTTVLNVELQVRSTDAVVMATISSVNIKPSVLIHGIQHLHHFPSDDPVLHMTYGEGAAGFASLHGNGTVTFYHPDGRLRDSSTASVPYAGITFTRLPRCLVGWGPRARLALLDGDLRPLADALDPLDVQACQVTEQSLELVTAGAGNVCVWCLTHMVCQVRVTEGLGHHSICTQLALAPGGPERPHRAFVVYRNDVVVVNLTAGHVLEHRRNVHPGDITALAYSSHLDCVVTASKTVPIRVWGPDWGLQRAFVGHSGVVTSLLCCPESGLLLSTSLDGTLRSWSLEEGGQVQCVSFPEAAPPMSLGGSMNGDTFYTFSQRGVDFWKNTSLYDLHCRLGGTQGGSVRQILVTSSLPPYPTRVLCVSGESDVTLIAVETGAIVTSLHVGRRVRCADYCSIIEMALVLTEDGALIWASTLTNPATLVNELEGLRQEGEQADGEGDQGLTGLASCMVLYCKITDRQRALDDWMGLRDRRDKRPSYKKPLQDAKNWFLVVLGHNGGCVSVLRLDTGEVQYQIPAHNGQRITSLVADPENSYLVSAGEDKAVLVWRVFPYGQECLSLLLNLFCGHPPLRLALLGPLLAMAFEEPTGATYGLVHFNLLNLSRTDHPPGEEHLDAITGLCVCPPLRVFASSSQDGTIRLWDEENRLIRTFQLNAQPECLAYSGERGDMFLGIRGDLYRIRSAHLPHNFHLQHICTEISDPAPDLPISPTPTTTTKPLVSAIPEEKHNGKQDLNKDLVYEVLLARNRDLASLQEGKAARQKRKPPATLITREDAFDRYMKKIYRQPLNIKIDDEDMFDLQAALFPPKVPELRPLTPPTFREGFFSSLDLAKPLPPMTNPARVGELEAALEYRSPVGYKPNSVLMGQLLPNMVVENALPTKTIRLREAVCEEKEVAIDSKDIKFPVYKTKVELKTCTSLILERTPLEQEHPPPPPPLPEKPACTMKVVPPTERPKPPTPPPPRTPTPEIPGFLKPFLEEDWFKSIYPDQRLIQGSLCPEEFSMQMLKHMQACGDQTKLKILSALLALHQQGSYITQRGSAKGFWLLYATASHRICRTTSTRW
ncbi:hypothetical protein DPEC_G00072800 [Dallia pectoralis]|uniref:Uncharacterized protein n=1 Tax=Dallia pectoralis TaxID=75939 RepID=A0ACC2H2N4_DALPE|nr:hypothetical protein DPEC_G00072800 [Dallia pectoralis]